LSPPQTATFWCVVADLQRIPFRTCEFVSGPVCRDTENCVPGDSALFNVYQTELENTMSVIDKALEANRDYAKKYDPKLGGRPNPKIAVVTCMDPRLSDLPGILGLSHADLDVIRTGGPAVTEDVLGELVVSTRIIGAKEIMLLNHTGCGFTTFTDDELNAKLAASTGDSSPAPMRFFSYKDPEQNTREQIEKVRSHPWIAKNVPVRGFVFDVETGLLREVEAVPQQSAALRTTLQEGIPERQPSGAFAG
jgi:carbonic anhydrase